MNARLCHRWMVRAALAALLLSIVGAGTTRAADDPVLVGAAFHSHTNNEDKDHDTGICLDIDARAIRRSACKGFLVHLWIHTHGNDTWRMNGWVRLDFSDGTNLIANLGNTELKNDGASVDFSAPAS